MAAKGLWPELIAHLRLFRFFLMDQPTNLPTNQPTFALIEAPCQIFYGQTNRPTNQPIDQPTDICSYRSSLPELKNSG